VSDVEAENQEEACKKAEAMVEFDQLFTNLAGHNVYSVEYADDLDGFLVDEDGDEEHERSTRYDADYKPL
jgi:hypothetical protein